jgi:hypothetical protein
MHSTLARTDCEGTLKYEEHGRSPCTACCRNGRLVLDIVNKACLDYHYRGHQGDHRKKERPTSDSVDEEP